MRLGIRSAAVCTVLSLFVMACVVAPAPADASPTSPALSLAAAVDAAVLARQGFGDECGDLDGDGDVDADDFGVFMSMFGGPASGPPDYNGNGVVDVQDYGTWLGCFQQFGGDGEDEVTLESVGDRAVVIGSALAFELSASGPSDDQIGFSASPLPLPTGATLDADSGEFHFRPMADQVGEYVVTFTASDGTTSDEETVTITVAEPAPDAVTAVRGQVVDTNSFTDDAGAIVPVVNAEVTVLGTGISTSTGPDGEFLLEGVPSGMRVLDIDAGGADPGPDGASYAGYRHKMEVIDGTLNDIDRPFFLPRIAASSLTPVDPASETVVENEGLGVTLTIPPFSAQNADGTDFTGEISVSEVPEALAPSSLPRFLEPGLLITIQPVGVSYTQPVPVSFPNIDDLPPGSETNLWSLNPEDGGFFISGKLQVSADGTRLETVSGGVIANDWHGPVPQDPVDDPSEQSEDNDSSEDESKGCEFGSDVGLHSGRLIVDHELVGYRSVGETRSLRMVYNSTSADPRPLIKSNSSVPANTGLPDTLSAKVTLGGVSQGSELFVSTTNEDGPLEDAARIVFELDGSEIPTGAYPYLLDVASNYPATTVSALRGGNVLVNNERGSPFGAGWTIEGLQRLHIQAGGATAVLSEGDGALKRFTPQGSLAGVATDLAFALDGSGSVSPSEFEVQVEGLAAAIENSLVVPPDGSVSLAVIQFSSFAITEIPLTNIDSTATAEALADEIRAIDRLSGGTDIRDGINAAADALSGSPPTARQVICVSTDGQSNVQNALDAANAAVAAGIDEIDTVGIGSGIDTTLLQMIADIGGGFFVIAPTFEDFAATVDDKLQTVIGGNPPGDFSLLARNDDGTYTRRMKDGTLHEFDEAGLHVATTDRNGRTTSYTYDVDGRLETITDPAGLVTTFTYADGLLASIEDPAGRTTVFEHDSAGALTKIIDPDGTERAFAYDEGLRMTSQTSKRGFTTDYTYTFDGRLAGSSRPDGSTREVTPRDTIGLVDTSGGMGGPDNPAPFVPADSAVGTLTDGSGDTTTFGTNRFGATTSSVDPLGRTTEIERDEDNLPISVTHPNGRVDEYEYDDRGNVTVIREAVGTPLERERQFEYDPQFSRLTKIVDELGRETLFEIDPVNGNRLKETRVVGSPGGGDDLVTTFTYLGNGLVDTVTDPLGRVTDFDYTAEGLVESITFAAGTPDEATQSFEYDGAGNRTAIIDANGHKTEFAYDTANQLVQITEPDPDGAGPLASPVSTIAYDEAGNVIQRTDAEGSAVVNDYDALDRLVVTSDDLGNQTAFTYDADGNLISVTDPNGNTALFAYDDADRRVSTTDAAGGVTAFAYDVSDNLASLTDPVGNETQFAYDPFDRLVEETDPLGADTIYEYDAAGNLTERVDRNGRTTEFVHDDLDRLVLERWLAAGGGLENTIDFVYDKAGNLLSLQDEASSLAFTYDIRDRIVTAATVEPDVELGYTYDAVGNILSVAETIDGMGAGVTEYAYDALGRMTMVTQGGTAAPKRVDFGYNGIGQFASIERFGDLAGTQLVAETVYAYDAINRLTDLDHLDGAASTIAFYDFTYDTGNRITAINDADGFSSYSYDLVDRLTGADRGPSDLRGDESYAYDANGNRTLSYLHSGGYVTGPGNRLLSDGEFDYAYDAEGNMVQRTEVATGATRALSYDHRNRLTSVIDMDGGGAVIREVGFEYDALDRRITKIVDSDGDEPGGETASQFVYDRDDVLLDFFDSDGHGVGAQPQPAARLVFGPEVDQFLSQGDIQAGTTLWALSDHLGTVRDVVDGDAAPLAHVLYDSFGHVVNPAGPQAPTRYSFSGRELDQETGMYYFRARFYAPRVGRFISEDPLGLATGETNRYAYVVNSPLVARDPDGQLTVGGSIFGGLGGGVSVTATLEGVRVCAEGGVGVGAGVTVDPFSTDLGSDFVGVGADAGAAIGVGGAGAGVEVGLESTPCGISPTGDAKVSADLLGVGGELGTKGTKIGTVTKSFGKVKASAKATFRACKVIRFSGE